MGIYDEEEGPRNGLCLLQTYFCQRCMHATWGQLTGCRVCLCVDVLLLNEARHLHGNTSLSSQPDAKPLNHIFLAESTSIASSLQSNGTVGTPDASTSFPTFKWCLRGTMWGA